MFEKKLIEELLGITKPWRINEQVMEAERKTIVVKVSCGEEVWAWTASAGTFRGGK